MYKTVPVILFFFMFIAVHSYGQADSTLKTVDKYNKEADSKLQAAQDLKQIPDKYLKKVDSKIDLYNSRMMAKTEKSLAKLSKWENKIHTLLLKVSPQTAAQLFGNGQETFATLLQKMQQGQSITQNYQVQYDAYSDKLSTNLKYLQQQKSQLDSGLIKPVTDANDKMAALTKEENNTDAVQQFIKMRRKQLADGAWQYLKNSKYLANINQESFYYIETMKNYKALFSDPDKAEQAAMGILSNVPGFTQFTQQNSMLASLFGTTASSPAPSLAGLQTRDQVQNLLQQRVASGGPNAQQSITQYVQQAQQQLNQLKDKVSQSGGSSSDMSEGFKPNMQKTKTLMQRIEYGFNVQFIKNNTLVPGSTDMALTIGYKLNDKSTIGVGASYDLGIGTIQHINFSNQGLGLRSYLDWELKKQIYITGGFEMNYNSAFAGIASLKQDNLWQQSALIGLTKKINIKTGFFKTTNIQLLYDLLSQQHIPVSEPFLFRVGYNF